MGIQNLFKNLISEKKLIEVTVDIKDFVIFIDFSCIFYTFLHACDNQVEFSRNINNYVCRLIKNNKVKLFIDKGTVSIKEKERLMRETNDYKCVEKIKTKINNLNDTIITNELNNEIKKNTLNTLNYKLNTYNNEYKKTLINNIISSFEQCKIYEKNRVDAEFYMCKKIIKYIKKNNEKKILIISNDQDVFLFLLNNYTNNDHIIIKYCNKLYKLVIDNISINMSILTLFFNKSDYFGIKNYLYDTNKINISMLQSDPEYTCEYIIKICKDLLSNKNKKSLEKIEKKYVMLYIKQLIMYIKIDYNIFNQKIISDIKINNILYILENY